MVTPEDVIETLNRASVGFVLMGTHGIGGWRDEPRATQDVDILVRKRDLRKAMRALGERFPELKLQDLPVVARFIDPATKKSVIDVMKFQQAVFKMVFRNTILVASTYRIPNLEMALVSKFAAMVAPNRSEEKKFIDAGDFISMVKTNKNDLRHARLQKLGEKVYPGGGEEVLKMVDDILAGRPFRF